MCSNVCFLIAHKWFQSIPSRLARTRRRNSKRMLLESFSLSLNAWEGMRSVNNHQHLQTEFACTCRLNEQKIELSATVAGKPWNGFNTIEKLFLEKQHYRNWGFVPFHLIINFGLLSSIIYWNLIFDCLRLSFPFAVCRTKIVINDLIAVDGDDGDDGDDSLYRHSPRSSPVVNGHNGF